MVNDVVLYLQSHLVEIVFLVVSYIFSFILLFLRKRSSFKAEKAKQLASFLEWLPAAMFQAGKLYPDHGSGSKKLDYVVSQAARHFPEVALSVIVTSVNDILNADKGGDNLETVESSQKEGSQDLCKDRDESKFSQSRPTYERRYTPVKK